MEITLRHAPAFVKLASVLVAVIANITAFCAAELTVPGDVVFERDIAYAPATGMQLNLARPTTGQGPFPAVVCIHGGGFRAGTREEYDPLCIKLAQHGYVAVTVSYRLAPGSQFP